MDSYRPNQSANDRNDDERRRDDTPRDEGYPRDFDRRRDDASRGFASSRDYNRSYDHSHDRSYRRPRDYDDRRSRGARYDDSHRQRHRQGGGYGYRDIDRADTGGMAHDYRDRIDYDDVDEPRDRGRFDPARLARHPNYTLSDIMRRGEQMRGPVDPPSTGQKDIDHEDMPSRFLLIRNLKPTLSEELLAKGLEKLYRGSDQHPDGATPMSLRRIMVVRLRETGESMGFAFAEFYTIEDAKAAWSRSRKDNHQFTIGSQPVKADFPHSGVFPPASVQGKYAPSGQTPGKYTFIMNSGQKHKYHDERYYVNEYLVNETPPESQQHPREPTADLANDVQTGSKRTADTLESVQNKPKKAKKTAAGPAVLPAFQNWDNKRAELRAEHSDSISEPQMQDGQSFAVDVGENSPCWLCGSRLASSALLQEHLRVSEKHLAFEANDAKRSKGYERLRNNGVDPDSTIPLPARPRLAATKSSPAAADDQQSPAPFRDRAAERRQEAAASQPTGKISLSLRRPSTAAPKPSKAAGMMQKMGWTEGQGLGESGRAALIEPEVFAAGVGLGHEASRRGDAVAEAERRTRGGDGFAEATRELARKRFEGME